MPRSRTTIVLPTEHGAYIMLLASWAFGLQFSHRPNAAAITLIIAISLCLFLAQESVRQWIRRGMQQPLHPLIAGLLALSASATTIVIMLAPTTLFVAPPLVLLVLLYFFTSRKSIGPYMRSLIGFGVLSLITPAMMLTSEKPDHLAISIVWIVVLCFELSSVVVVGIRLRQDHAMTRAIVFHVLYALITIGVCMMGIPIVALWLGALAIARFIAIAIQSRSYQLLPIKTVGIIESIITALAVILSATAS